MRYISRPSFRQAAVLLFSLAWNSSLPPFCDGSSVGIDVDSRHAFSLSTFDPNGKLRQVEYAAEAAAMGTPIVALCRPDMGLFLASPQVLPSPLILDDGTARFARVTSNLLVSHSGISADGRVLVAACQELAVQHEYVYDEPIPLDIFLEEMSLLYQEYTMKPNARPFGATLVVAHLNLADEESQNQNCFYRIDPSGAVECLGNCAVVNGDKMQRDGTLLQQLEDIATQPQQPNSVEQVREKVIKALEDALRRTSSSTIQHEHDAELPSNVRRILTASLNHKEGMTLGRFEQKRLPPTIPGVATKDDP